MKEEKNQKNRLPDSFWSMKRKEVSLEEVLKDVKELNGKKLREIVIRKQLFILLMKLIKILN